MQKIDISIPLDMVNVTCPCCGCSESSVCAHGYDYEYGTSRDEFTFVRCNSCSVLFLNPRPVIDELKRIYPSEYEPYHFKKKGLTFTLRRWREIRKARELTLNLPAEARILDAGCGSTSFLDSLNKAGGGKWELWGNDLDDGTCKRISEAGYSVAPGRFEELSLSDGFFDMIIMEQVIEHLDNPIAVINKAFRLLNTEGKLVIETPNGSSLDARLFEKGFWGGYHFPRHWTIFNPQSLTKAGMNAGFAVQNIKFMFSPAFWVQSLHHYFLSLKFPSWVVDFFSVKNPIPVSLACMCDFIQMIVSGKTSNMRIIFSVPKTRSNI